MKFREISKEVVYRQFYDVAEMSKPQIVNADRNCTRAIKECEEMIAFLQETRLKLAERYQSLENTGNHIRVTLRREVWYDGKVLYRLETHRVYDDGTTEALDTETYPGTERAAVLRMFKQMQKDKPHQEYVLNIKKKH